jgi:hypothetical protein
MKEHHAQFAANLSMLFTEVPFLDRFERAAQGRLRGGGVPVPLRLRRPPRSRPAARRNGLKLVLHNLPAGDWAAGERGIACHPDRVDEFRAGVAQGHRVRHRAGRAAAQLPGRQGAAGVSAGPAARDLVEQPALRRDCAEEGGLKLLIEPINTFDIPGFYLNRTDQAIWRCWTRWAPTTLPAVRHLPRAAHGGRAGQHAREAPGRASATSSWPTTRAATSRAPARSTTPSCSRTSTASATPAGSAANTSPPRPPRPAWAGDAQRRAPAAPLNPLRQGHRMTTSPSRSASSAWASWARRWRPPDQAAGHQLFVHTRSKVPPEIAGASGRHAVHHARAAWPSRPTSSSLMVPDTPDVERCCSASTAWPGPDAGQDWWST